MRFAVLLVAQGYNNMGKYNMFYSVRNIQQYPQHYPKNLV